jgi:hypothetical protein
MPANRHIIITMTTIIITITTTTTTATATATATATTITGIATCNAPHGDAGKSPVRPGEPCAAGDGTALCTLSAVGAI